MVASKTRRAKKSKGRRYRPKRSYQKSSVAINRGPSGVADRTFVKLHYRERITMTNTAGAYAENFFAANGCYDPNITGTGAQPTGFDQWMGFYNAYRVRGSKISVELANVGSTNPLASIETVIVPVNDAAGFSSMDSASASAYAKRVLYAVQNGFPKLTSYLSTKKFCGDKPDDDSFTGTVSSNPTELWYWQILSQPVDRSSGSVQYAYVDITYYVEFFDRRTLILS